MKYIHEKKVNYDGGHEKLIEDIGNLHYESLRDFLLELSKKIYSDGEKDMARNRPKLANSLFDASENLKKSAHDIDKAWIISKPYMD